LPGPERDFEKSDRIWITCLRNARKEFPDYTATLPVGFAAPTVPTATTQRCIAGDAATKRRGLMPQMKGNDDIDA
jgi:hypothetical protein